MILDHSISRPLESPALRYLSLGAGVQSSVLALMSARGDLPPLDAAIFADTGKEPRKVYAHLDWLEGQLPYPLVRVRRAGPNLGDLCLEVAGGARPFKGASLPPFFMATGGTLPKQCNAEFKRDVVYRAARALLDQLGVRPSGSPVAEQWMGMTTDELGRIKDPRRRWIQNRWPLLEMRMSRQDCQRWAEERQYPPFPKSACIFCPYRSDEGYRRMDPEDFAEACAFDAAIRNITPTGQAFVHRSLKPLAEVQFTPTTGDLFDEDCEGYCGV